MPNGERMPQIWRGDGRKTMDSVAHSTKNAAQLLHQNIGQDTLRYTQRSAAMGFSPHVFLPDLTHKCGRSAETNYIGVAAMQRTGFCGVRSFFSANVW
ncbi:hypothetical protein ACTQ2R_05330 [Hallella faecis]|uniref:hypothetical protein n=1 Tax=Hallella faecis TaxID=2841596 RepID=UPI003F8E76D9